MDVVKVRISQTLFYFFFFKKKSRLFVERTIDNGFHTVGAATA